MITIEEFDNYGADRYVVSADSLVRLISREISLRSEQGEKEHVKTKVSMR